MDKENRVNRGSDGLQCRIEGHLASMFPSSAGYFSGNDGRWNVHDSRDGNDDSNDGVGHAVHDFHVQNNGKPISKAAEFFHPRPVMALMPYQSFFSPLVADVDDGFQNIFKDDKDDKKQGCNDRVMLSSSAVDGNDQRKHQHTHQNGHHYSNDNELRRNHYQARGIQYHQQFALGENNNSGISSAQNVVSSQEWHGHTGQQQQLDDQNQDNDKFKKAIHNEYTGKERDELVSSLDKGPRDLFQAKDNATSLKLHNSSKSPPAAQSKISQNPKTGQLGLNFNGMNAKPSGKKEFKSWNYYSGEGRAAAAQTDNETKEKNNRSKSQTKTTKKKEASSMNGGQSEVENLIDSIDQAAKKSKSKKRTSDPVDESVDKVSKKSKQTKLSLETAIQNDVQDTETKTTKANPVISINDFAGLEETGIQNAASCMEGLKQFLRMIGQQSHVTWTMLFLDKYYDPKANGKAGKVRIKEKGSDYRKSGKFDLPEECVECTGYQISTAFFPNSKKYCTEKGEAITE